MSLNQCAVLSNEPVLPSESSLFGVPLAALLENDQKIKANTSTPLFLQAVRISELFLAEVGSDANTVFRSGASLCSCVRGILTEGKSHISLQPWFLMLIVSTVCCLCVVFHAARLCSRQADS